MLVRRKRKNEEKKMSGINKPGEVFYVEGGEKAMKKNWKNK